MKNEVAYKNESHESLESLLKSSRTNGFWMG